MEKDYGLGLVGLVDPVTKEFNHDEVIRLRGGIYENEYWGNTKDMGVHHVLAAIDYMVGPKAKAGDAHGGGDEDPRFLTMGGKKFDQYDAVSMLYGGIRALQPEPFNDDYLVSECFIAMFDTVTVVDYLITDVNNFMNGAPWFNILFYDPIKILGNIAATYEYCNLYIYVSQAQMLFDLDFGFLSELGTRILMILSTNLQDVLGDLWD